MIWFVFAVLAHSFFALGNIVDAKLQRDLIKNGVTQLFLGAGFASVVLIGFLIVLQPSLPPASLWGWTAMGGLFAFLSIFPYFAALKGEDSSVVVSYFSLGKIFVPVLSFFILDEQLDLPQYIGFAIVLLGSFFLRFRPDQETHMKPLVLMMISSIILAMHYIAYKLVFEQVGWLSGFLWGMLVGSVCLTVLLWLAPGPRKMIREDLVNFKIFAPMLSLSLIFGASGTAVMTYAINLSSPTLVAAFSPFQPFLVFFIGLLLSVFIKTYEPFEITGHKNTAVKLFSFALMGAGIILVLFG
jgi:drug/metabolite transporter (DMT)-like permease